MTNPVQAAPNREANSLSRPSSNAGENGSLAASGKTVVTCIVT